MPRLCRLLLIMSCLAGLAAACFVWLNMPALATLIAAGAVFQHLRRQGWPGTSHGTARLASLFDLLRAGMLGRSDGVIIGRASLADPPSRLQAIRCLFSPTLPSALACRAFAAAFTRRRYRGLIRIPKMVHALTCAPAGAGKSVSVLIPNLLSYPGSCVVVDPKGELYAKTARHRRRRLGHKIHRLDPFGLAGPAETSATLNPLDFIAADDHLLDEVRILADSMVVRTGHEHDQFWNNWSVLVVSAFLAYICGCERNRSARTLRLLRDIVTSRGAYQELIEVMGTVRGFGGIIAKFGGMLSWLVDRELGSVMASVQQHTAWMDGPPVAANLARSSFDPRSLRSGKVTIYLILPHDKLTTLAPLMRMWLSTILRVVTRGQASEANPILFLVDEAAHIGKIESLQTALTLMRGYGIRVWLFFQSIDQLRTVYGEHAPIILGNTTTQQYFGTNSYETAEEISRRIGEATILSESRNGGSSTTTPTGPGSGSQAGSYSTNRGWNQSEAARRVIKPEELMVLPDSMGLVFHKNMPPIAVELPRHYADPEFRGERSGRERGPGFKSLAASVLLLLGVLGFATAAAMFRLPDAVLVTPGPPGFTSDRFQPIYGQPPPPAAESQRGLQPWMFEPDRFGRPRGTRQFPFGGRP